MIVNATHLNSNRNRESLAGRILSNFIIRLFLFTAIIVLLVIVMDYLFGIFTAEMSDLSTTFSRNIYHLFLTVLLFYTYKWSVKILEKRRVYELTFSQGFTETIAGMLLGSALIFFITVILFFAGFYNIISVNPPQAVINGFFLFVNGAMFEELLFRLIIFRLLEEYFGSWISLIFSAMLFGGAHLLNDNATLWSAFAIAIEAGMLLSLAFIFTRRIWLAFGIHFGWNFTQATILGLPASGISFDGLVNSTLSGPAWLTGGEFGLEASPVTILFGLLLSYFLFKKALLDNQIILPAWSKKNKAEIFY